MVNVILGSKPGASTFSCPAQPVRPMATKTVSKTSCCCWMTSRDSTHERSGNIMDALI